MPLMAFFSCWIGLFVGRILGRREADRYWQLELTKTDLRWKKMVKAAAAGENLRLSEEDF